MSKRRRLAIFLLCGVATLALAGCSSSKGNAADLLQVTPDPSVHGDLAYMSVPLEGCQPLPEPSAPAMSNLRFQGPCSFTQHGAVQCVNKTDDYYAYVNRQLPDYGQFSGLINVEKYKGPGKYTKNSVVMLQVARKGVLYEWKQQSATLTVTENGNQVIVEAANIPAVAGGPARGSARVEGTLTCRT